MSILGYRGQSLSNWLPMAWELDGVSLRSLLKYATPSGRLVSCGTRLSCPGNSTVYRLDRCQVPHSKCPHGKPYPSALTDFNPRYIPHGILGNQAHLMEFTIRCLPGIYDNNILETFAIIFIVNTLITFRYHVIPRLW